MNLLRNVMGDGKLLRVTITDETDRLLAETSFRGTQFQLAGNFCEWRSARQMFGDTQVRKSFTALCERTLVAATDTSFQKTITLEFDRFVGWAFTERRSNCSPNELEPCQLDEQTTVLQVTQKALRKAPLTRHASFKCFFRFKNHELIVAVRSIYPGQDTGPLKGDMTKRESAIFFRLDHPGEPLQRFRTSAA